MNLLKRSLLITMLTYIGIATVQAEEQVGSLPTIRIMAESELREEVGLVPFQEDIKVRQALQHYINKQQTDIQNAQLTEVTTSIDYQPRTVQPDLSQVSPFLEDYIMAVAMGFQSSNPSNGVFKMLEPLNINRDNANAFREGTIKVSLDDLLKLQQQIEAGLKTPQNFLTR
ncbi:MULTISPECIES: hypothetical protein [Acinetobacter]|jgi:hypothetical protein|uniref:hypothetical protein n=1 Tax=Acinetobacter TaxID=469 RepID=UPI0002D03B1F|nr:MULTISPECIES: hypothetical protein [Acinetobacter]ENV62211.1 hypothetical protein F949_03003 [Acinetobacter junii NIPH 182]MBJ8441514.1 hypothetical protein [Acinetobacter junii]MDH0717945.1 hypothetical protein [Acinetobacter junii]MDH1689158.1 hypothetical protein [Acinetobacter junii]MQZ56337.1 hypothetical protein [Acinetobacter junii]